MGTPMRVPPRFKAVVILATALALVLSLGVIPAQGTWESMAQPKLASRTYNGAQADDDSWDVEINDDGRYMVFESDAGNLTEDDSGPMNTDGEKDVFRFDRLTGMTELVSVRSEVPTWTTDRGSREARITDDGRYVMFVSGNQFVEEDTNNSQDIYVKDMDTGEYRWVNFRGGSGGGMDNSNYNFVISGDGSFLAFTSTDGDILSTGVVDTSHAVWGYDLESDEATLVSAPTDAGVWSHARGSRDPAISDDGRYVSFLTGNGWDDSNGDQDLYVRDMDTGEVRYLDVVGDGSPIYRDNYDFEFAGDGTAIVWTCGQDVLPGDPGRSDVYYYDLESDEATIVSGPSVDDRGSRDAGISDDGHMVVFQTGQSFDPEDPNGNQDFYMKDMTTGEFTRIPVLGNDSLPGDDVWDTSISGDGAYLAFESNVDLSDTDWNGNDDIYYTSLATTALSQGVTRLSGEDRYTTAVDVSMQAFPEGASTVVIATGEDWPDALGGSALAGAVDGPMLLTGSTWLNDETVAELTRLGARNVYLLGGYDAVSPAVETQLELLLDGYVWRIGGPDRYATSKAVANEAIRILGHEYDGTACVTTGYKFADAVGASPLGSGLGWPVLLVRPSDPNVLLPPATTSAVVIGGTEAVGDAVETYLEGELGDAEVDRVGGATRYETSALVAQYGVDNGLLWNGVGITSGMNYPDALTGGVACGLYRTTMLLTPPTSLHPAAADALTTNAADISDVTFLGGMAAVSATVQDAVIDILGL